MTQRHAQDVDGGVELDLVRSALAGARSIARTTPVRPIGPRGARRTGERPGHAGRTRGDAPGASTAPTVRNTGGYSAAGPDPASDPQQIGAVLNGWVSERGWDRPLAQARVFAEWPALVGADVAAHCAPQSLTDGVLRIAAESTAWATQLRLLAGTLLARLVADLGTDVVTSLHISGPTGPSWNRGRWTVRGRGPRDTYG